MKGAAMSGWGIAGIIILALIVGMIVFNLKDLIRYIKISSM